MSQETNAAPQNINDSVLNSFKKIKGSDIKITQVKDGKYSVKNSDGSVIAAEVNTIDAATYKILDRYRQLVDSYKTKKFDNVADFFHQIESNREYHVRQCVCIIRLEGKDVEIKKEDLEKGTLDGLNAIDLYLFEVNKKDASSIYEKLVYVNDSMVDLAMWEVANGILQKETIDAVTSDDVTALPSHIRMLSKVVKETGGSVTDLYPHTIWMNYSHFYPIVLYHTGKAPGEMPAPGAVKDLVNNDDDMTPEELAEFKKTPTYLRLQGDINKKTEAVSEPALPKASTVQTSPTVNTQVEKKSEALSNAEIAKRFNEAYDEKKPDNKVEAPGSPKVEMGPQRDNLVKKTIEAAHSKLSRINIERQAAQQSK